MFTRLAIALSTCVALVAGTAMLAAPGQATARPGDPTEGKVWVENRGRNEAIPVAVLDPVPVVVQNVATTMPVRLAGSAPGLPPPPVAVQRVRQGWEYLTLSVPADATAQELTNVLTVPGNNGWEAAGVQIVSGATTLLLMKRPRP